MSVTPRTHVIAILSIVLLCLVESGCDDQGSTTMYEQRTHIEQLQRQLQQEQSAKEHATQERARAEHVTRKWQGAVAWVSAGAVLMLVVGAALGSRARKDAQANRTTDTTDAGSS